MSRPVTPRVWRRQEIEEEIDRLRSARPTGARSVRLVHEELEDVEGVLPSIGLSVSVLDPGERSLPHRHSFSIVNYIREGHGFSIIAGRRIDWGPGDVFTTPAWAPHLHTAAHGSGQVVRFAFDDSPLYRALDILLYADATEQEVAESEPSPGKSTGNLLTYEEMMNPFSGAESALPADEPALWRNSDMHRLFLERFDNDEPVFHGRRVGILHHPGTGRARGTTSTLAAAFGLIRPNEEHTRHRHFSAPVALIIEGSGYSVLDGKRYDWEAGDVFITPAWSFHRHGNDGSATTWNLAVQDVPLLGQAGTLLWQESEDEPIVILGATRSGRRSATA